MASEGIYADAFQRPFQNLSGCRFNICITVFLNMYYYIQCVVTLSVYPTPGKLKNQPDHGGNRTRDLWFASPMLYQLSYEVKSVRVFDISELNLAPSISVCF